MKQAHSRNVEAASAPLRNSDGDVASTLLRICAVIFLAFCAQSAQALTEDFKLTASDATAYDWFGYDGGISVDGNTALVGAPGNNYSGSVFIFTRNDGVWSQQQKLTASDTALYDRFGNSVSVSGDTAVVGAIGDDLDTGSVYVFTRSGGVWLQQAKLNASDAWPNVAFGFSVSLSGDTVLIGVPYDNDGGDTSGSAYIFTRSSGVWTQQAKLTASDATAFASFGYSVSVSGDTALIGAPEGSSGSAYVFNRSGGVWSQQQKLTASDAAAYDFFGSSVSVSGDTALVGARFDDGVSNESGSAYVFIRSGTVWTEQAKLVASDTNGVDYFGNSVSVSGDTALIGAPGSGRIYSSGSAYVFTRSGGVWSQQQQLIASDASEADFLGSGVSLSGDMAFVGSHSDNGVGEYSGSVYVFALVFHNADQNNDHFISFSEILRVIQLYNIGSLYCDALGEDGFSPGTGDTSCAPHSGDYNPQDWAIDFNELLRMVQLYNSEHYYSCPGVGEDGFCPGMP